MFQLEGSEDACIVVIGTAAVVAVVPADHGTSTADVASKSKYSPLNSVKYSSLDFPTSCSDFTEAFLMTFSVLKTENTASEVLWNAP